MYNSSSNLSFTHQFREKTDNVAENHVRIVGSNKWCSSSVGKSLTEGEQQDLNLSVNGCMYYSTFVHEFLHAYGIHHESNSPNRDDYITTNYTNILEKYWPHYHTCKSCIDYGVPYDGRSFMSAEGYAYHGVAVNQYKPIIISKVNEHFSL